LYPPYRTSTYQHRKTQIFIENYALKRRFNTGLEINVESGMPAATVQGLKDLGHQTAVINDSYQDFGAGQFIWRMGDPKVEGYQVASDPRRDGQAVGF
jgi:gamma-glutamyltranspeptidase / glutathione hydrolase